MRKGIFLLAILTIAVSSSALGQTAQSKMVTNQTAEQELAGRMDFRQLREFLLGGKE